MNKNNNLKEIKNINYFNNAKSLNNIYKNKIKSSTLNKKKINIFKLIKKT